MSDGVEDVPLSVGIFGVMSYTVGQRVHEMGIRAALGARPGDLVGLVVGAGMRLCAFGLLAGGVVSLLSGRVLGAVLYGVSPADAATLGLSVVAMAAVGFLAAYLPARRASRVDPIAALRRS